MRKLFIIGIGAGNPDYVTVQAINALNKVDVFFIPDKGSEKDGLNRLRTDICERFITQKNYRFAHVKRPQRAATSDYKADVDDWHARIEADYQRLLAEELGEDECGAFLVWGDPALYDSTLRIVERIAAKGTVAFDYELIPGISAVQALAAQHRVALNRIGEPVMITTGRKLAEGFPDNAGSAVVMLDGEQAFKKVAAADLEIFWGAYVGTQDEVLVSGPLSEVKDEIEKTRAELRAQNGWIMDIYLLRTPEK
ncbi:MAG TPA: precorrin-6A synthase (deacetylating) [Methylovirgula sp.]|jgi:precorrin-6A synthase|nr:precorrin-6A synthase (deacetylating) [Methylovirgula sp.]